MSYSKRWAGGGRIISRSTLGAQHTLTTGGLIRNIIFVVANLITRRSAVRIQQKCLCRQRKWSRNLRSVVANSTCCGCACASDARRQAWMTHVRSINIFSWSTRADTGAVAIVQKRATRRAIIWRRPVARKTCRIAWRANWWRWRWANPTQKLSRHTNTWIHAGFTVCLTIQILIVINPIA